MRLQIDKIVAKQEKSLSELISKYEGTFFRSLKERRFKQSSIAGNLKAAKFGNKAHSFASQQMAASMSSQDRRLHALLEHLRSTGNSEVNPFGGKRVLEVGCGTGAVSIEIAAHYGPSEVIGCDIDP